jgi:glycosyltransferase involved in cell wall biosynthesis
VNIVDNIPLSFSIKNTFNVDSKIIEYGGDHVDIVPISDNDNCNYPFLKFPYDLSISRAQPDNNLHLLLETYKETPQRNLVLISNWNISDYGIRLKEQYLNRFSNIFVVDAVYDIRYLNVIRSNTSLYIHSHSQCGTAPSLVEAMNYNIPIICFDVETNRSTTQNLTFYFRNKDELLYVLSGFDQSVFDLIKSRLYDLARFKYSWKVISEKYYELF